MLCFHHKSNWGFNIRYFCKFFFIRSMNSGISRTQVSIIGSVTHFPRVGIYVFFFTRRIRQIYSGINESHLARRDIICRFVSVITPRKPLPRFCMLTGGSDGVDRQVDRLLALCLLVWRILTDVFIEDEHLNIFFLWGGLKSDLNFDHNILKVRKHKFWAPSWSRMPLDFKRRGTGQRFASQVKSIPSSTRSAHCLQRWRGLAVLERSAADHKNIYWHDSSMYGILGIKLRDTVNS